MSENTDKMPQWCKDAADELNVTSGIISTHKSYSGPGLNIVRAAAIIAAHAPALPGGVREAEVHTPDGLKVYDSPHGLMVLAHEHNAALAAPKTLPEGGSELWHIGTAPKDGSFIILFGPSGYAGTPLRAEVGHFVESYNACPWRTHSGDAFEDGGLAPTHWLPLPALPSPTKETK